MATLLERLRSCRAEMTGRERQIASYLEAGYPHAGLESATAVGERVNVSPATVVRFIAKLGYGGYAEFQRELRDEVEARLTSPLQRLASAPLPESPGGPASLEGVDVLTRSFEAALACVTRTYGALDRPVVDAIVTLLLECRGRIWIIGEKKGRSVALYLYAQLNLCLERVTMLTTDASFEADRLLDVGPDDVVIAVDVRRYVERCVQAAEWCRAQGAAVVVLSDGPTSPLFGRTSYRLAAATNSAGAFDSYLGLMLIADLVTNIVADRAPERARRRLEVGEKAWAQLRVFTRPEPGAPVGDPSG
ncbi:MAG TPA: MurR/RpiR family transcriptional regulator [Salinarimonas sp.]|jgi:DNA-binding MurR/RpiR family transcriptional regulator|nr:MurR/RpiR family transcriptional regulator [Salinarimonas sp.]